MRLKRMEGRETLSFVNWPSFFFPKNKKENWKDDSL